jgi:hypothetical protein
MKLQPGMLVIIKTDDGINYAMIKDIKLLKLTHYSGKNIDPITFYTYDVDAFRFTNFMGFNYLDAPFKSYKGIFNSDDAKYFNKKNEPVIDMELTLNSSRLPFIHLDIKKRYQKWYTNFDTMVEFILSKLFLYFFVSTFILVIILIIYILIDWVVSLI